MNSRHLRPAPARAVAPIHRAPQALPAATGASPFHHAPNAALLIDFDNVTMGIRSDLQTELRHLLASDIIKGKVAVQRAYADWRRYPQYIVPLAESSIDMIMAPAYGSSKKNATDIRLAVDAIELVFTRPEIGTYILLSGDSDFASLVTKLKEYGKYVIGVGIRESSSDLLVMNCDEYYSYNSLAGLVSTKDEDSVKRDPWELAAEAIHRMKKNGDVMRSDRLKQVMQEIDGSFDEKNLGISKFSRFCMEAAQKGILSATKMENGQLEVDIAQGRAAPAATAAPAPVRSEGDGARPAAAERGRRGRRGGRGRGRDREEHAAAPADGTEPRETGETVTPEFASVTSDDIALASAPQAIEEMVLPPASPRPPASHQPRRRPEPVSDDIGSSGERLTRDEAFSLVKRAVGTLVSGDDSVPASRVRAAARNLLGRDSESLSERNFIRILRDSHDADMIDLRKRGDDYDVAPAASAPPVSDQLSAAAAAAAAAAPPSPSAPVAPRGMGPRGIGAAGRGGRRGFAQRPASGATDLLLGAVTTGAPPAPIATPAPALAPAERGVEAGSSEIDEPPVAAGAAPPSRRKRASKSPSRAAKTGSARAAKESADPGAAKPRSRRGAKKPASGREG